MSICYLVACIKGRNDIADVAWGIGFMILTEMLLLRADELTPKHIIALMLVLLWGSRLALHISNRNSNKSEDARYRSMREKWKYPKLQGYTNVFMLQGILLLVVSTPIMLLSLDSSWDLYLINYIGIIIWMFGFLFESVGDFQLSQFIKNSKNKGSVMQTGLWQFTRHPNYFGEITLWWGFYLFTYNTPYWLLGLVGPATITFLILGVSGIPMLEARYKGNKEYDKYKKRTSSFLPLPPKC